MTHLASSQLGHVVQLVQLDQLGKCFFSAAPSRRCQLTPRIGAFDPVFVKNPRAIPRDSGLEADNVHFQNHREFLEAAKLLPKRTRVGRGRG